MLFSLGRLTIQDRNYLLKKIDFHTLWNYPFSNQIHKEKMRGIKKFSTDGVPILGNPRFSNNIVLSKNGHLQFKIPSIKKKILSIFCLVNSMFFFFFLSEGYPYFLFLSLLFFVFTAYIYSNIEEFIQYNIHQKKLTKHFKFITYIKSIDIVSRQSIKAFAVQAKKVKAHEEHPAYWAYQATIVTTNGKVIELTNFWRNAFPEVQEDLKIISEYLNIPYLDYAISGAVLSTYGTGDNLQMVYSS
ncbi:MAG: hypothetical protein COB02_05190 [Candidatus Cloacimonadota bacterium]|nr:MAG: hypothetical protein COB02_05190 [Candidatus Cloacimonadota bacterium]